MLRRAAFPLLLVSSLFWGCSPREVPECPGAASCLVPDQDSGVTGCADDTRCPASAPRCLVAQSRCVGCLSDGDCAAGACDPVTNQCTLLPDSCGTAQKLSVGDALVTVKGDTTRAVDDTQLSCALPGTKGNDLVYVFTVDRPRRLLATATALTGSALMPVIGLRKVCSSLAPADNAACAYGGTTPSAVLATDVQPGTWYLWVDGEGDSAGAFELNLQLEDTSTAESCSSPTPLVFSGGRVELNGDTRGHTDDSSGQCGGSGTPDNVYAFTLADAQRVRIEVEPGTALYAPAVYLRGADCSDTRSAAQVWCGTAAGGQKVDIELPHLEAGTYHLFVDGVGSATAPSAGPFRLVVTLLDAVPPPTNDVCATATALAVPTSGLGVTTVQGDTSSASGDALGCSGTGNDLVYRLELTGPRKVSARVAPLAGSTLRPSVYLRRPGQCESDALANQLACATAASAGSTASLLSPSLPAGLYTLWVDGVQGTRGAFELTVELSVAPAVPANDVCMAPGALALASGVVTVSGTTVSAGDDTDLLCTVPTGGYSPDVVYSLNVPVRQAVAIDVTAAAGSALRPVVGLREVLKCSSQAVLDNLNCAWDDPQLTNRTVMTLPSVAPGSYSLWVEGDGATQGDFTLRVTTSPEALPPHNDWCGDTSVPTLTVNTPLNGDTRAWRWPTPRAAAAWRTERTVKMPPTSSTTSRCCRPRR